MSCPMYEDYSRGCVDKFPGVMAAVNFHVCQSSDGYKKCVVYRFINEPNACCKYIGNCNSPGDTDVAELIHADLALAEKLAKMLFKTAEEYCLSDKKVDCARYKLFEEGKEPAKNLLPDGTYREELPVKQK